MFPLRITHENWANVLPFCDASDLLVLGCIYEHGKDNKMAASVTRAMTFARCYCRKHAQIGIIKHSSAAQRINYFSTNTQSENETESESITTDYEEMLRLEEEERIESLRNISGLTERQRQRLHGLPRTGEMTDEYQNSVKFQRKLYGKMGAASGVDPRLSWVPKKKALELAKLFREREPPLEERLAKLKMDKDHQTKRVADRQKKIAENMAKMDQWIEEYKVRLAKKDAEVQKKEERKRKILEEAREYFGYYVDPRDAKFQEMLEEKEAQEKLLAKKQKKEKKLEKMAARLQHMAKEAAQDKGDKPVEKGADNQV